MWLTTNRLEELNQLSQNGKNFSEEVVIVKEPEKKDRVQKIIFTAKNNPEFSNQKILANVAVYPEYSYGDKLKIDCLLEFPENKDAKFDYQKYLAKDRIYYICQKAKISVLEKESQRVLKKIQIKTRLYSGGRGIGSSQKHRRCIESV
jgi:hypothetical protein